jgi:hypothetical protein
VSAKNREVIMMRTTPPQSADDISARLVPCEAQRRSHQHEWRPVGTFAFSPPLRPSEPPTHKRCRRSFDDPKPPAKRRTRRTPKILSAAASSEF